MVGPSSEPRAARGFFASLPERSFALWLLGLTLGLRLVLLPVAERWLRYGDPVQDIVCHINEPHVIAARLLTEGCFCTPFVHDALPTAHSGPPYVALLAAVQATVSPCGTPDYTEALLFLNLLSAAGTALLLWRLSRRWADEATARRAALIWAALPMGLITSWTAGFAAPHEALLAVAAFAAALSLQDRAGAPRAGATGLLCGVAVLELPVLGPPLAFAMLLATRGRRRALLVAGLGAALVLGPWAVRNQIALGGFAPVRANFGLELASGNHPLALGGRWMVGATDDERKMIEVHSHPSLNPEEKQRYRRLGELAYSRACQAEALAGIAADPSAFIKRTLNRVLVFWFDDVYLLPDGLLHEITRPARWPNLLSYALLPLALLVLAARGLGRLWARDRGSAALLGFTLLLGPAPYYITNAIFRYKLPFLPLLVAAAAIGWGARADTPRADPSQDRS